ncbi:MAG: DUF1566 domain-containing protein [Limnohabitans sp.]
MSLTPSITIATLPALGADLQGGTFAGITTQPDGTHCAVILLPDQGSKLTWNAAVDWAKALDAELPTRPVAAMLFANIKDKLRPAWHWTSEEDDASGAWGCSFFSGSQHYGHKSFEGSAVAVRLIPLTA